MCFIRRTLTLGISCLLFSFFSLSAQVNFTADEVVSTYEAPFGYGANMGFYSPWRDEQLADIAAGNPDFNVDGVGVNSLRPALFAHFLEQWGYDIRVDAFQHYEKLGIDNTVFVGYPSPDQRAEDFFCTEHQSELFKGLYEPIWDGGANGTAVNEANTYALYLYKLLEKYKDYINIYEVWNEPDFDYSGNGWKTPDMPNSWWNNDPGPCDIALRAPIYYYVRLLRISYEVIKTYDPTAYVAIGGLGYPSFLDAVLRNTDEPSQGLRSADFPKKGGAYFDVMSFHSYPHIDGSLRVWNDTRKDFDYSRHSDAAAEGVIRGKEAFEAVLAKYGYDGSTYPNKHVIITECAIPRKTFGEYIGSDEAQRNFVVKSMIRAQQEGVKQIHVYQLGEISKYNEAVSEFHLMGLYEKLENTPPYRQKPTDQGIAFKTMSESLKGYDYDAVKTQELLLPKNIKGGAFTNERGETTYVLWAATERDRSEAVEVTYNFPALLNAKGLEVKFWDYSKTNDVLSVDGSSLRLTGSPVYIQISDQMVGSSEPDNPSALYFDSYPNPFQDTLNIVFKLDRESKVTLKLYDVKGHLLATYYHAQRLAPGAYQHFYAGELPAGVYVCKLFVNNKRFTERIVKLQEGT